jgi:hypothetical protein
MNKIIHRNFIRHLLPVLVLMCTSAQAGSLNIPNNFQAGSKAMAAQVNANFTAVEAAVDGSAADIATLQSQISALTSTVNTLLGRVDDLEDALADVQAGNEFVTDLDAVVDVSNNAVTFSGVNVKINNGNGATAGPPNGLGNLIVGYDEARPIGSDKSGSHNVVVGAEHNYTQNSGLVVGVQNTISGVGASVSGGNFNTASGDNSSVSGGISGTASGANSSVTGGVSNVASGEQSSVSGGNTNLASGTGSTVSGGTELEASDVDSWAGGAYSTP